MFRKLCSALLFVAALTAIAASVPGLVDNVALAECNPSDPTCGG